MNFLGVGPAELIVILVVALIFVGPERLPRLAADIARTIREIRKYTGSLAAEFNEVIQDFEKDTAGDRSQWREIGEGLTGATKSVTDAIHGARADMSGTPADAMPIAAADANGTASAPPNGTVATDATGGANPAGGPVRSTAGVSSEKWISIGEPGSGPVPGANGSAAGSVGASPNGASSHDAVPPLATAVLDGTRANGAQADAAAGSVNGAHPETGGAEERR